MKASYAIAACKRCGKQINKADEIVRWDREGQRSAWVHANCEAPAVAAGDGGDDQKMFSTATDRLVLPIENKTHDSPGTIGWLQSRAKRLVLGPISDLFNPELSGILSVNQQLAEDPSLIGRAAYLLDAQGKLVITLAVTTAAAGIQRQERTYSYIPYQIPGGRHLPWTGAAWALFQQIRDLAVAMLDEPPLLAGAMKVEIGHRDRHVRYLAAAALEDPVARAALIDHLQDTLDLPEVPGEVIP